MESVDSSRRFSSFRFVLCRIVFAAPFLLIATAQAQTYPTDKVLEQLKTDIVQKLQEGDWLAEQVERGVERYLQKIKAAQDTAATEQRRQADEKGKLIRPISPGIDHIRGNPEADISIVEYSDFECPYCRQFHSLALRLLEAYDGRVNWIFRHFPLAGHNPAAQSQAEAAVCVAQLAGDQAFWAFADAAFLRNTPPDPQRKVVLPTPTKTLRVEKAKVTQCVASGTAAKRVAEDIAEGERIGIIATPTTVLINHRTGQTRVVVGTPAMQQMREKIAELVGTQGVGTQGRNNQLRERGDEKYNTTVD